MRRQLAGLALAVTLTGCGVSTQQEIEMGGQYVGPIPNEPATASVPTQAVYRPQARIFGLAAELGIGTFKTYNNGDYAYPKIPRLDSDEAVAEGIELIKLAIKHFGG